MILAESSDNLQIGLDMYSSYFRRWKQEINNDKIKVMVFARCRRANYIFTINGIQLEVVSDFKYLGILFDEVVHSLQQKGILPIRLPEQCLAF